MIKVLLVDDEYFIMQGLAKIVDWEENGFEIVGMAGNGAEALELIRAEHPQFVIADIRMPVMNGLELLEALRAEKEFDDISYVILSGYNDFEYARRALLSGCFDYMLKPIDKDDLLGIMNRVREIYESNIIKNREEKQKILALFARNAIPVILGKFDNDNIRMMKKYLGECTGIRYVSVELDTARKSIRALDDEKKRELQKILYGKCLNLFAGNEFRYIFDVSLNRDNYDVGIIYSKEMLPPGVTDEEQFFEEQKERLIEAVDFRIRVLAGPVVKDLAHLSDSSRPVLLAQSFHFIGGEREKEFEEEGFKQDVTPLSRKTIDSLIRAVEANDHTEIEKISAVFYEGLTGSETRTVGPQFDYLMYGLIELAASIDSLIDQQEVLEFISDYTFENVTIDDGGAKMTKMMADYSDYLVELRRGRPGGLLKDVESDIEKNYAQNLTLKEMGKKYFINAAYLGQIFKKQYGESFKDYLNKVRIKNAEELLMHTDIKIVDVAERVGYRDVDYFIDKFISLKGCTPAKFRKQVNGER